MPTDKKFDRVCAVCGKPFQTNRRNKRTCSLDCSRDWMADKNRRAYHRKKTQVRVCKICGKTYVGSDLAGFCSSSCRSEHYRRVAMIQNGKRNMLCPWTTDTISEDLRGVSPALGF